MKIPQRDDQVRLDAPQTQAGRAVQPVEGSLGDSYIKTMRDMSKQFDEISQMQFKLSENAVKGQLNAFDIYVDSRTKQYNQDLQLATTKEQIDGLFAQYKKDVAENGTNILGSNLYQNWERVKGGTSIANAEYAGEVANTLLLNKQNKELAITSLDTLNIEAGNAATPQQEKEIREKAYALINSNVENATFDAATGEKLRRKFDFELDKTKIERDIYNNPEEAIKKLHTNDYAPAVAYPERERFLAEAMKEYRSSIGTGNAKVSRDWMDYWGRLQQTSQGTLVEALVPKTDKNNRFVLDKEGHLIFEVNKNADARYMASMAATLANNPRTFGLFAEWVGKITGKDANQLHVQDLFQIREQQMKFFDYGYSPETLAFQKEFSSFKQQNQLIFNDPKAEKADNSFAPSTWATVYDKMNGYGRLDRDANKLFTIYENAKSFTQNVESEALLGTGPNRNYVESVKAGVINTIVADVQKGKLKREGPYAELYRVMQQIDETLSVNSAGDKTQAEYRFLDYLMANNNVPQLFSSDNTIAKQKAISDATAIMYGVSPSDLYKKDRKGTELLVSDTPAWQVTASLYTKKPSTPWADWTVLPSSEGYSTSWSSSTQQQALQNIQKTSDFTVGDAVVMVNQAVGYLPKQAGKAARAALVDYLGSRESLSKRRKEESRKQLQDELDKMMKMTGPYSTKLFVPSEEK